jgi:hypothetical protein
MLSPVADDTSFVEGLGNAGRLPRRRHAARAVSHGKRTADNASDLKLPLHPQSSVYPASHARDREHSIHSVVDRVSAERRLGRSSRPSGTGPSMSSQLQSRAPGASRRAPNDAGEVRYPRPVVASLSALDRRLPAVLLVGFELTITFRRHVRTARRVALLWSVVRSPSAEHWEGEMDDLIALDAGRRIAERDVLERQVAEEGASGTHDNRHQVDRNLVEQTQL